MSWEPRKPAVNQSGGAIYRPEAYGAPGGVDAAVDTPLVQAAIDAASATGEPATVRLDGTYAIQYTADISRVGPYQVSYGLWVNASNLTIEGGGTLKTLAEPSTTYGYIMFLVGNGGFDQDTDGVKTYAQLQDTGTWIENVTIRNLTIDNDALDNTALDNMGGNVVDGVLVTAFVRNCLIDGVTVTKAWGHGGIVTHCSSVQNTIQNCTITLADHKGMHLDGAEDTVVDNVTIGGVNDLAVGVGIGWATNTDYRHGAANNTTKNCTVNGGLYGITMNAYDQTNAMSYIQDNTVTLPEDASITRFGIAITVNNLLQKWPTKRVTITGNSVNRTGAGTKGWGLYIAGSNNSGDPITCESVTATGNTFGAGLTTWLAFGQQAKNNSCTGNTIQCSATVIDNSGGTASDNVTSPNP